MARAITEFRLLIPIGSSGNGFHPANLLRKIISSSDPVLKAAVASNVPPSSRNLKKGKAMN